jgi:hypothetical protein
MNPAGKPSYRFYVVEAQGGESSVIVTRSSEPLGLPREKSFEFDHNDGDTLVVEGLVSVNTKIEDDVYAYDTLSAHEHRFKSAFDAIGLTDIGILDVIITGSETFSVRKPGGKTFTLAAVRLDLTIKCTKQQAYSLYVDGMGGESEFGLGMLT